MHKASVELSAKKMLYPFGWLVVLTAQGAIADKCDPTGLIKQWQQYSPCAYRTGLGVLIGFGYNLNQPNAKGDLALLGIDHNDIPKGIITQTYSECDCEKSVCLSWKQSQRLFHINVDRARKQVSTLIRLTATTCCDIQDALTGLIFTFGVDRLRRVPDLLRYAGGKKWRKLGAVLLMESWCKSSDRCMALAERIVEGCNDLEGKLGCSPPTPKACDQYGKYCCASNNTCCQIAACCSSTNSCCPSEYPVCCGGTNSCCFEKYPVCCFPGTPQSYCCSGSSPVCLGERQCGSLDPGMEPVEGKRSYH